MTSLSDPPIFDAVRHGDALRIQILLEQGADINETHGSKIQTALSIAALNRDLPMVQILVGHGADLNRHHGLALRMAAMNNDLPLMRWILSHPTVINPPHHSALHVAANLGHYEAIQCLIEYGANPKDDNSSALRAAVYCNESLEIIDCLIQHGADIHAIGPEDGLDSIGLAAGRGWEHLTHFLIQHGASLERGFVAATKYNQPELFAFLTQITIEEERKQLQQIDPTLPDFPRQRNRI